MVTYVDDEAPAPLPLGPLWQRLEVLMWAPWGPWELPQVCGAGCAADCE